jgi:hypothetical protein
MHDNGPIQRLQLLQQCIGARLAAGQHDILLHTTNWKNDNGEQIN